MIWRCSRCSLPLHTRVTKQRQQRWSVVFVPESKFSTRAADRSGAEQTRSTEHQYNNNYYFNHIFHTLLALVQLESTRTI